MHMLISRIGIVAVVAVAFARPESARAFAPFFTNQTASAGLSGALHETNQDIDHWDYAGGCTVGDFNDDGWQDLFFCGGGAGGRRDRLYINNGDGTFSDQAMSWGVGVVHRGKGAAVGDYDADGDLDLYVVSAGSGGAASPGQHKLYRNNGNDTFTNVANSAGVDTSNPSEQDGWSANFADYDLDGDLDLFVTGFDLFNAGSKLFRNSGDGTFTDVTPISGTGGAPLFQGVASIFGFTPLLVDMDGDRYPDLMYVGDFGSSHYFKNNGNGTFTEWTFQSNAGQEENGMGGNVGDFNNDGKMDYYATSIKGPPVSWTGNKLYKNVSTGVGVHDYDEIAISAGVDDGGYGWGSVLIDFNHDTRLDIIATSQESANYEGSVVFQNQGNDNFNDITIQSGFVHNSNGRSLLNFDYDNDGDQDIVVASNSSFLQLYRNDLPAVPASGWLRVFLDSSADPDIPPDGIGSFVKATIGATTMTRAVHAGGFEGSSELSAHFGLGFATTVDELRVEWPNGAVSTLTNVAANQTLTVFSSSAPSCGMPGDMDNNAQVNGADMPGFIRAKLGEPPFPGENPDCADYGTGTLAGDILEFVSDLIS